MLWFAQLYAEASFTWMLSAPTLNLAFAMLCVAMAYSPCPRRVAWLSALLYILLAFC